jgi:hypothetical protein
MATEIRRLLFTNAETMDAITSYAKKNNINFSDGRIIRAKFAGGIEYEIASLNQIKSEFQSDYNIKNDKRTVTLTVFRDDTLEQKYFNLTANFISSALIEYCMKNKIMLPRDSEKSLDLSDFNICLDIGKHIETEKDSTDGLLKLED